MISISRKSRKNAINIVNARLNSRQFAIQNDYEINLFYITFPANVYYIACVYY